MKKVVLQLDIHDDRDKQKAMKAVSRFVGVDSISVNMKLGQLTVIGDLDPIELVGKLRKQFPADLVSVGSAKEEKKADDKKGGDEIQLPVELTNKYYTYPAILYNNVPPPYEDSSMCVIC